MKYAGWGSGGGRGEEAGDPFGVHPGILKRRSYANSRVHLRVPEPSSPLRPCRKNPRGRGISLSARFSRGGYCCGTGADFEPRSRRERESGGEGRVRAGRAPTIMNRKSVTIRASGRGGSMGN